MLQLKTDKYIMALGEDVYKRQAMLLTVAILAFIVIHILVNGIPYLTPSLFEWEYTSDNCSVVFAIINTLYIVGMALLIGVPIGIFAAIYLVEYVKRGNRVVRIIRLTTETLSGIPSIVSVSYTHLELRFYFLYLILHNETARRSFPVRGRRTAAFLAVRRKL